MQLKKHILTTITAAGLGLIFGWGFAGHEAKAQDAAKKKTMDDPKEYELYDKYQKAAPKDKPAALEDWKKGFPNSAFAEDRENMILQAWDALKDPRKTFDKAVEILNSRPNYYYAIQAVIGYAPLLNPVQPADLDNTERIMKHVIDDANTVFSAANKPEGVNDAQWAGIKPQILTLAQRTYAWVFITRRDNPKAEVEITKYLQMDGTQAQFTYFLAQALLAQNKEHPEKAPPALFHFARAASYDGQNSLLAPQRKTILDYLTKSAYVPYHCSEQGLPELLTLAKANVFPPAGFNIKSCADIQKEQSEKQAAEDAANPVFAFWRDLIKKPLLMDPNYWMNMEGALIPGEAGKPTNVDKFKGKLISQIPATKPKTLMIAVEKPDTADVTLVFEEALPGSMDPGSELQFEGVAKAFTKDPFMLTLEVTKEQLVGWTGTNPKPAAKQTKSPAAKGGATKGATKAPAKGK